MSFANVAAWRSQILLEEGWSVWLRAFAPAESPRVSLIPDALIF
jgi:hypothetical protein